MKKNRWLEFERSRPSIASRIRELVLPACDALHGKNLEEQIKDMQTHEECKPLYELLKQYGHELGISDDARAYAAFIMKFCFYTVMKAENRSS